MKNISLKWLIVFLVVVTAVIYLTINAVKDQHKTALRQAQSQLSSAKKITNLQQFISPFPHTAPAINASTLNEILTNLAEESLLHNVQLRLSPKPPLVDKDVTLQQADVTITFKTFLDSNVFQFLNSLQEVLEQPLYLKLLTLQQTRQPDAADFNLLENGQITDLLEGRIVIGVYFVE